MASVEASFLTSTKERGEFTKRLAPPDFEVILVDNSLSDTEKIPRCKDVDAIITVPADVSVQLLAHCPNVRLIQTLSAGYDPLDVKAIGEMGIPIANNGGANAIAAAEQTIALMISVSKRMMLQWHDAAKVRRWREGLTGLHLEEVTGKTVGIVGLGRIGKQVAKRLKGFDTRTIYYDIVEMPPELQQELNGQPVAFEELPRQSDIVTLHVLLARRTRGMIGERELAMMKPTAVLINACRGPVVNERALYRALRAGRIAGAGLDVLEEERSPADNPLFQLDTVVITPHMAVWSDETNAQFAFSNIRRVLAGQPPESLVTPED